VATSRGSHAKVKLGKEKKTGEMVAIKIMEKNSQKFEYDTLCREIKVTLSTAGLGLCYQFYPFRFYQCGPDTSAIGPISFMPTTLPRAHPHSRTAQGPMEALGGEAVSVERGTPVPPPPFFSGGPAWRLPPVLFVLLGGRPHPTIHPARGTQPNNTGVPRP